MKTLFARHCLTLLLIFTCTTSWAQWTGTGSNVTTGATEVIINNTKQTSATFWFGPTNTGPSSAGNYYIKAYDYWGPTVHFQATGDNGNEKMNVTIDGKLSVGITDPGSYDLNVNGYLNIEQGARFGCYACGSGNTLFGSSNWGTLTIQGRVISASDNLHLSAPGVKKVIINDSYRAAGGTSSGNTGLEVSGETILAKDGGNVGIGLTNPASKLEVNGDVSIARTNKFKFLTTIGGAERAYIRSTDGEGGDYNSMIFAVGGGDESMAIKYNGNVGIGTTNPSNKLDVAGTIRAEEIKVEATPWPDYVFSDSYELSSLSEVSDYIDENGHLPNIPSASEVEENGIKLGEMNAKLLEKIEELTLYLIEEQERNNKLEKRLEAVENILTKESTK